MDGKQKLIELTAQIVAAYVGKNAVAQAELPKLIADTFISLQQTLNGEHAKEEIVESRPAVNVRKSVTPEYIICLEDGKKFKSLKRHLRTHYNLSPEQYREKWKLPSDYPMVAPSYAEARSSLAKRMGLGQRAR
jgi:predicted transcriptional regulator